MPFQSLQQICQLYNYENNSFSEGPSFCFDHKLEGMVQRTPAAMFFEKWSSSQLTTSGVKKPKFSSNRDTDILSQLTVPNCKKLTAIYAAPTIENRPFPTNCNVTYWWWTNDSRFAVQVLRTTMWQAVQLEKYEALLRICNRRSVQRNKKIGARWACEGGYPQHKSQRTKQS